MLIDIGPAVQNNVEPYFYLTVSLIVIGIVCLIVAGFLENSYKHNDTPWYVVGGIAAVVGAFATIALGMVWSTNSAYIAEAREVQAAEAAGYAQVQDGPTEETLIGENAEGDLVILHVSRYSDTEYIVSEIEG
jgi:hypothetical protein